MPKKRIVLSLFFALAFAGCAVERPTDSKPDGTTKPVVVSNVTADIKAARQQSATLYAEQLERIAADIEAGKIVYDTKLQLELSQASRESAKPIQDVLAKYLPSGKITDQPAAAHTIRQLKAGYE